MPGTVYTVVYIGVSTVCEPFDIIAFTRYIWQHIAAGVLQITERVQISDWTPGLDWPLCHCAVAQAPPSTNTGAHSFMQTPPPRGVNPPGSS